MLAELLLIGGWAFWIIVALIAAFEIFLLVIGEDGAESHGFATGIAVAAFVAAILFTNAFQGIRIESLLIGAGLYLAIGVIWSIKKWYSFVVAARNELRARFDRSGTKHSWEEYAKDERPLASNNKQRIVSWMAIWPFSVLWWVLTWPRRAFVWLYERMSTLFDRITDRVWAVPR